MKIDTKKLERLMAINFLNGSQLAEKVGFSRVSMSNILRGRSQPKPENLRKMCAALKCGPEDLLED